MIQPKNLLIVRTDRIGDVILSLPLAGIIKKHFPDCKITFLLRKYTKSLAEHHKFIDEVLVLRESDGVIPIRENIQLLKKFKFDSCIVVYPTYVTSLIMFLSGIKNRIGTGYRWYSFLFNNKVYTHRKYAEKHELEFNVDLLKVFGISEEISPNHVDFDIPIDDKDRKRIKSLLKSASFDKTKPTILVHPGSGGSAIDLPVDKMRILVEMISTRTDSNIFLTGSSSEKELCESLKISGRINNFAGQLSLSELVALIEISNIFIANSTGPLHIASALDKYIIGFYPKILACSPKRWGPYSNKSIVFLPEIKCSNCNREQCEQLNCMNSIDLDNVFNNIEKILKLIPNSGEIND